MKFEKIDVLRTTKTKRLRELVALVEGDPDTFFDGAALDGVDVRGDDLRGINLDKASLAGVRGNILTKTDREDTKLELLTETLLTIDQQFKEDIPADDGKLIVEYIAIALYVGDNKKAEIASKKLQEGNVPENIYDILLQLNNNNVYKFSKLISSWFEKYQESSKIFNEIAILSSLGERNEWSERSGIWFDLAIENDWPVTKANQFQDVLRQILRRPRKPRSPGSDMRWERLQSYMNEKVPELDFPERAELYVGTIAALKKLGRAASNREIEGLVRDLLGVRQEVLAIPRGRDHRTKFQYELAWVRTYLKWAGALTNPERGVWKLTPTGENMSDAELRGVSQRVLAEKRQLTEAPPLTHPPS